MIFEVLLIKFFLFVFMNTTYFFLKIWHHLLRTFCIINFIPKKICLRSYHFYILRARKIYSKNHLFSSYKAFTLKRGDRDRVRSNGRKESISYLKQKEERRLSSDITPHVSITLVDKYHVKRAVHFCPRDTRRSEQNKRDYGSILKSTVSIYDGHFFQEIKLLIVSCCFMEQQLSIKR